jgi:hypothetical protein
MKLIPRLRHTVLQKLCRGWPPWREASPLSRDLGDTAPSPGELIANACFGRLAENERLALEGLIAGEPRPARPAAAEPPGHDPTEPAG